MCGADSNTTNTAMSKPVPPAALAAALVMIVAGIVIILAYGSRQKKAWRPERTYVVPAQDQDAETNSTGDLPAADELMDEAVQGLEYDNGLSNTLETALIPE